MLHRIISASPACWYGEMMGKRKATPIQHHEIVLRFANRLRELRRTRGMTQKELAERAELTETYLSRLESAGAAPGIDLVARLATALGATVHELLPLADPPDTLALLREQANALVGTIGKTGDQTTLSLLNQILTLVAEANAKR